MRNDDNEAPLYYVWGADRIVYGPVELPTLVDWVQDGRVLAETWLYLDMVNAWQLAADVAELKLFFTDKPKGAAPNTVSSRIQPEALQRIKMLAGMDRRSLESMLRYMQPVEVAPFAPVVRPGESADGMFFILEGELRAYVMLDGKETTLATLLPGESFGEVALVDHGPRSAWVSANQASLLLRLPREKFDALLREAPALATPFAMGIARSLATRLRQLNRKYEDSVRFSRAASDTA
jgi:CRP-like cAMP-binding protein